MEEGQGKWEREEKFLVVVGGEEQGNVERREMNQKRN